MFDSSRIENLLISNAYRNIHTELIFRPDFEDVNKYENDQNEQVRTHQNNHDPIQWPEAFLAKSMLVGNIQWLVVFIRVNRC
jgi:hypothetical protein